MRDVFQETTVETKPPGDAPVGDIEAALIREGLEGQVVCPFCGVIGDGGQTVCPKCTMENTAVARKATKLRIGPWYVLQNRNPAAPGMKWETLLTFVRKGRVKPQSIVRGPSTHQLWRFAAHVKGLSREFGVCYSCGGSVEREANVCPHCNRLQEPPANPDTLLEGGEEARLPIYKEISPEQVQKAPPVEVVPTISAEELEAQRVSREEEELALRVRREEIEHDREVAAKELEFAKKEREIAANARETANLELARVRQEQAAIAGVREEVNRQKQLMEQDRDAAQREAAEREQEEIRQEHDAVAREREAIAKEKAQIEQGRDELERQRVRMEREREVVTIAAREAAAARETAFREVSLLREKAQQEIDAAREAALAKEAVAAKESAAARDIAIAKEIASARETAAREALVAAQQAAAVREVAARESAARETTARDTAARETAAREALVAAQQATPAREAAAAKEVIGPKEPPAGVRLEDDDDSSAPAAQPGPGDTAVWGMGERDAPRTAAHGGSRAGNAPVSIFGGPRTPAATPAGPAANPSGAGRPRARDSFLSPKDLAAAFKLNLAPAGDYDIAAKHTEATPEPAPVGPSLFSLEDLPKPQNRAGRKVLIMAVVLLVVGGVAVAVIPDLRQKAMDIWTKVSSDSPKTPAVPAGKTSSPKDDLPDSSIFDHSSEPLAVPVIPSAAQPSHEAAPGPAPAPAPAPTSQTQPARVGTLPSTDQPASFPPPPSAETQAQAKVLYAQARDAEIRLDYEGAVKILEQLEKLPRAAWPGDVEFMLGMDRKHQTEK